jgi:hypothetical protein
LTCITENTADSNCLLFVSKEEGKWLSGGWRGGFYGDLKHNDANYTESQTKLKTRSTKFEAKPSK